MPPGVDKSVLQCVLGIRAFPATYFEEAQQALLVTVDELPEGLIVAREREFHELLIGRHGAAISPAIASRDLPGRRPC